MNSLYVYIKIYLCQFLNPPIYIPSLLHIYVSMCFFFGCLNLLFCVPLCTYVIFMHMCMILQTQKAGFLYVEVSFSKTEKRRRVVLAVRHRHP